MIKKNNLNVIPTVCFLIVALATPLFGHISVNPRTSEAGIHHKLFYVRAPVEREIPVVELGIEVSEEWRRNGGDLNSFQDVPGMDLHVEFDVELEELTYEAILERLIHDGSEAIRSLSAYHVAELGLTELEPQLEASRPEAGSIVAEVVERALAVLRGTEDAPPPSGAPHVA